MAILPPPHSWAIGYSSLVPIKWACTCTLNELAPRNTYFQLSQGQFFSIFSRKLQSNDSFGHRVCGPSPPSSHNAMGQAVGACGGPQWINSVIPGVSQKQQHLMVRVGPPAPTPLRMLATCTQWVRGGQVEASSTCWKAVLEELNLEIRKMRMDR